MSDALQDKDEVLFRQIHPKFYDNGEPSSQPFRPTDKDGNKLSVDRSHLTSAQASYELFVGNGYESDAVYGLSVGEFDEENLPCISDPLQSNEQIQANPAHAYADYSAHGTNKQKNIAKRLKKKAIDRGILHPLNI